LSTEFARWFSSEQFVIELLSGFDSNDHRATIVKVVGTVKEESVRTMSDDGVTQTVVASSGIKRVSEVQVPSPCLLRPYRSFPEIEQPESSFVFRMQSSRAGELPQCALFESDGGRWKLEAIKAISIYLKNALGKEYLNLRNLAIIA
jgi:hypothetical protein